MSRCGGGVMRHQMIIILLLSLELTLTTVLRFDLPSNASINYLISTVN